MPGYLIDTNILSEIRKGKSRAHPEVWKWWLKIKDAELFISVMTVGEIRKGIDRLGSRDPEKKLVLENWLLALKTGFVSRMISVTPQIAETWGRLQSVRSLPEIDAILAATAIDRNLTLVTRNVSDFADLGVNLLNPFP